jgi:hypothetical protein
MPIARPLWLAVPGDPTAARQDPEAAPLGRLPYFFRCGTRPFAASRASE